MLPEEKCREVKVWTPSEESIDDDGLLMYLRAARSIALHAGLCVNGYLREGYSAAGADQTTQRAYDVLWEHQFDTSAALQDLVKSPDAQSLIQSKYWSAEETK